ncbi:MAG: hypothetical protein QM764_17765 [Chitinophagaceae bacterium]
MQRIATFSGLEDATPMLQYDRHAQGKRLHRDAELHGRRAADHARAHRSLAQIPAEFEPVLPILEPMLRHWDYSV